MSEAIVFISHNRIKPGKLEGLKSFAPEITGIIEREKPGTLAMITYADEEGTEAHIVHVFPNADAMQRHLQGLDERASAAFEFIETTGYEIYGSPSGELLEMMRGFASQLGAELSVRPQSLAGYLRASS